MSERVLPGRQPVSRLTDEGAGLGAGHDAPADGADGVPRWLGTDTKRTYASAAACFTNNTSCEYIHPSILTDSAPSIPTPADHGDGDAHQPNAVSGGGGDTGTNSSPDIDQRAISTDSSSGSGGDRNVGESAKAVSDQRGGEEIATRGNDVLLGDAYSNDAADMDARSPVRHADSGR